MQHQDLRTPEEKFDDLLADDFSLDEIAYRLGWSRYHTDRHYRGVCQMMGELPDDPE
jgi:hypothetical protein